MGSFSLTVRRHSVAATSARVCLLLAVCLAPAARVLAQDPGVNALGVGAQHGAFSLLPWEQIDPFTGNVLLISTDLVMRGNAGFDLTVRRYYNTKTPGGGWLFDYGFPRMALPGTGWPAASYPVIVMSDGTYSRLLQQTDPDVYLTTSWWRYRSSTRVLESPNGRTYQFDAQGRCQFVRDRFGNQIDVNRGTAGAITSLVQHLGEQGGQTQDRTVSIGYNAAGDVTSMTANGRVWEYGVDLQGRLYATSPTGATWTLGFTESYSGGTATQVTTVTTPTGHAFGRGRSRPARRWTSPTRTTTWTT